MQNSLIGKYGDWELVWLGGQISEEFARLFILLCIEDLVWYPVTREELLQQNQFHS